MTYEEFCEKMRELERPEGGYCDDDYVIAEINAMIREEFCEEYPDFAKRYYDYEDEGGDDNC